MVLRAPPTLQQPAHGGGMQSSSSLNWWWVDCSPDPSQGRNGPATRRGEFSGDSISPLARSEATTTSLCFFACLDTDKNSASVPKDEQRETPCQRMNSARRSWPIPTPFSRSLPLANASRPTTSASITRLSTSLWSGERTVRGLKCARQLTCS
jgi:hypothetical protein